MDYIECAEVEDASGDGTVHYVTFTCDGDSGYVVLAAFSDATCSTRSSYSIDYIFGREVIFDTQSVMDSNCIDCAEQQYPDEDGYYEEVEEDAGMCAAVYPIR